MESYWLELKCSMSPAYYQDILGGTCQAWSHSQNPGVWLHSCPPPHPPKKWHSKHFNELIFLFYFSWGLMELFNWRIDEEQRTSSALKENPPLREVTWKGPGSRTRPHTGWNLWYCPSGRISVLSTNSWWRFTLSHFQLATTAFSRICSVGPPMCVFIFYILVCRGIAVSPEKLHLPFILPWCDP